MDCSINLSEIYSAVNAAKDAILPIVRQVGDNPESGFKEVLAANWQCDYLKSLGMAVTRNVGDLDTAFRADFSCRADESLNVAFLTEYDALQAPLGHACGHQLIMGAGLLAATALQNLMVKYQIPGTLSVLGCPGEEQFGGKIVMLENGAFDNVDAAFLSHPFFRNGVSDNILAVSHCSVEFFGRSAHASTAPEQGINALDAMTIFMNGINAWRQQLPSSSKVHGIITNGGAAPNVIPDYTSGFFYVRSADNTFQQYMKQRLDDIAHGAALITGCDYKLTCHGLDYSAGKSNKILAGKAKEFMRELKVDVSSEIKEPLSTDFANVCDRIPGVNIFFDITKGEPLALHSEKFRQAAAAPEAMENMLNAAVVMTALAVEYMLDEKFRAQVKSN